MAGKMETVEYVAMILELTENNTRLASEVYKLKRENITLRYTIDPERGMNPDTETEDEFNARVLGGG